MYADDQYGNKLQIYIKAGRLLISFCRLNQYIYLPSKQISFPLLDNIWYVPSYDGDDDDEIAYFVVRWKLES